LNQLLSSDVLAPLSQTAIQVSGSRVPMDFELLGSISE
jgi:hypothetical protein